MISEDELELARRIARFVAGKWSAADVEDVSSELILWLYEHADQVENYRDGGEGKLVTALKRVANRYCAREQREANGAPLDRDDAYSLEQVATALPFVFHGEVEHTVRDVDGIATESLPAEYGLARAIVTDLKIGLEALPEESVTVLILRYRDDLQYKTIGRLYGITTQGAHKRVKLALTQLRDVLSGA